jgi:IMP dehydrogenase/GMP reductase
MKVLARHSLRMVRNLKCTEEWLPFMHLWVESIERRVHRLSNQTINDYVPEGVEAMVSYKGSVVDIIRQLVGGLRSGLSYCGANTIAEMQKNAKFIKITSAGYTESLPHDVEVV